MKILRSFILLVVLFISEGLVSQNSNANHTTVSSVKVKYKSDPSVTTTTASPEIKAIPEATVVLKTTSGVSKIYLSIYDNTNTLVYQVNYNINSSPIDNGQGKKMFENNNGTIFISNGQAIILKPYTYKITTEDSQSTQTTEFSVIQ